MNLLDWCLVLVAVAYALSGYWQGFITGAFATVGLILGGLLGIWLAPMLLGDAEPSLGISLAALFVVLVCASFGQAFLQYGGVKVRDKISWQPVRALDAVGGAVLSVVAVLIVTWMLGVAISGSRIPGIGPLVRESSVLTRVNEVMPGQAQGLLRGFDRVVGSSFFPRYLEPFAPEQIVPVEPPPGNVVRDPEVQQAELSVFKIRGSNSCGDGIEGSGFLYSPRRMMTNAHVVAGVSEPKVRVGTRNLDARVVYYNSDLDVAILDVDIDGPAIKFDDSGKANQPAVVLGYPNDGPFDAQPARIRSERPLRSPDIYGRGTVTREVFSVRGKIRPGNSGGPLVSRDGRVLGVVFAASVSDKDTGYALTADQVAPAAAKGLSATEEVSTGGCA
ncbi:serine protease [Nocardioides marmoriginsengisoli]|uniref:Serine protease n=1 Tax=Nocardioides marmoriginsengisoli TaxID=661483 RepID=A0A3N0CFG0_9ACTN|nr:MarP family serine protease [Nocardioides marmoriginsengisoli]RNL62178.1 serine protease [Nocardioides marmoriginsengisoli]